MLLALVCWLYPVKVQAQKTDNKIEYKTEYNSDYVSEDIVIKDNAIVKRPPITGPLLEPSIRKPISPQSGRDYSGKTYSKDEVIQLITNYSIQYGISPVAPLRIAKCESGYNQFAKNPFSTAKGVFEFLDSTWANQPAGKRGVSVYDADANVQAAVWLLAHGKFSMWQCK